MSDRRIDTARAMIACYNAQDADGYVAPMIDDVCEANYRGAVLGVGKDGVRAALEDVFTKFPENRADIISGHVLGNHVVLHERVFRSSTVEPFEVMSIYSFEGEKVSRVEFVR